MAAAIAGLMLALAAVPEASGPLRYDRAAIAAGQWWRLLTGQVVHAGARHAALNIAGLLAVLAAFGRLAPWRHWAVAGLAAALGVGGGLFLLQPGLGWYVGASGWLYGLVAAAGVFAIARRRWVDALAAGAVIAVRVALALLGQGDYSPGALADIGVPVVEAAHWYGAAAGAAAAAWLAWRRARL